MSKQVKKSLVLLIYFILAVSTLLVFWPVTNFGFVGYDDDVYVYENPHVLNGLTAENIRWAFTTGYASFWHPLTWLSLMLDCQLFTDSARWMHFVNLLLHLANTLLLFAVLKKMTASLWSSAFVAALFALHPLHVESVAWISERKDVLSTFFWLLAMLAYAHYVKKPRIARYLLVLLIFALGLMAKPMLVTLPFVFLLLDFWPLNRIKHFDRQFIYRLVLEKIPFIVLSIASSVVAFLTQQSGGALSLFASLPLKFRAANASISYLKYMEKMFIPTGLAPFYPHPAENVSFLYAAISAVCLLAVTILVLRFAKNRRYLVTGWFWYLVTLIPVIGIIQLGAHAMADRYTYITLTGLFIIIAWLLPQLLAKLPQHKIVLAVSMAAVLTALGMCAHRQVGFWNNNVALFSHAIEVTQNNYIAYNNLGLAYADLGRFQDAVDIQKQTIKIRPDYADAYNNLGSDYGSLGRWPEAIEIYKQAVKIKPDLAKAHYNLGVAYGELRRTAEAIDEYKQAIHLKPDYAKAYFGLGVAYSDLGRWLDAIDAFKQAVKIKPDFAEAYVHLGVAYGSLSLWTDEIKAYQQAIKIKPDYAGVYNNLGITYTSLGRYKEAIDTFKQAIRIKPDYTDAHFALGFAYLLSGNKNSAFEEYNILKTLKSPLAEKLLAEINK